MLAGIETGPGIMISKLCCPACWQLFQLLTQSSTLSTLFTVHGSHYVLYPVELPVWLPEEVINELIEFFWPILVDLLKSIIRKKLSGHSAPPRYNSCI